MHKDHFCASPFLETTEILLLFAGGLLAGVINVIAGGAGFMTFPLLVALVDAVGPNPSAEVAATIGQLTARLTALRRLCISVAVALSLGSEPVTEAAMVKDLGTQLEGVIGEVARQLVPPGHNPVFDALVEDAILSAPGFTLRGGTNEILRGIVARHLGVR